MKIAANWSIFLFLNPASNSEQDAAVKLEQERAEILAKYDKVRENSCHSLNIQIPSNTLPRKSEAQQTHTLIQPDTSLHHSSKPAHGTSQFDVCVFIWKILCILICDTLLKRCLSDVRNI